MPETDRRRMAEQLRDLAKYSWTKETIEGLLKAADTEDAAWGFRKPLEDIAQFLEDEQKAIDRFFVPYSCTHCDSVLK